MALKKIIVQIKAHRFYQWRTTMSHKYKNPWQTSKSSRSWEMIQLLLNSFGACSLESLKTKTTLHPLPLPPLIIQRSTKPESNWECIKACDLRLYERRSWKMKATSGHTMIHMRQVSAWTNKINGSYEKVSFSSISQTRKEISIIKSWRRVQGA